MVRPHILFTAILRCDAGCGTDEFGDQTILRWFIFLLAAVVFIYISEDVLKFTETESLDITSSSTLSHRAAELSKATTGVNIQDYGLFMRMFTFWFRPLFFDGLGILGSRFHLKTCCTCICFHGDQAGYINLEDWNGWFRICLFFFLFGSFALARVTENLGIAMRQKAQLMPFFLSYTLRQCLGDYYSGSLVRQPRRL